MWKYKDDFDIIPETIAPVKPKKKRPFPKFTPEQIEKGKRNAREKNARAVLQFTYEGKYVAEYPTLDDAAKQFGGDGSTICNACKLKSSKSAYGYQWRYKGDILKPFEGIAPYKNNQGHKKRSILQYSLDGVFIKEWESIKAITEHYRIGRTALWFALTGRKESAFGFKWQYKDSL